MNLTGPEVNGSKNRYCDLAAFSDEGPLSRGPTPQFKS
jgi:hypothetical protein